MKKSEKRSANKQEKMIQLYNAALKVFARYGYKKATVEAIAGELGMTKGNIYLYVKDKKDLYQKTTSYAIIQFQEEMRLAIQKEKDVVKQIVLLAESGVRYFMENKDFQALVTDAPNIVTTPAALGPGFSEIRQRGIDIVKEVLSKGVEQKRFRDFDVDYVAELLYHFYQLFMINTFVLADVVSEGKSASKMYNEIVDLVLHGIVSTNSISASENTGSGKGDIKQRK